VVGTGLLLAAAMAAHSVALLGFGLDSLIEIGASMVVVWQLRDKGGKRRRRALQVISVSFIALAIYIGATAAYTLTHRVRPVTSVYGTVWLALTFAVMLALAAGKLHVGKRLNNPVLAFSGAFSGSLFGDGPRNSPCRSQQNENRLVRNGARNGRIVPRFPRGG